MEVVVQEAQGQTHQARAAPPAAGLGAFIRYPSQIKSDSQKSLTCNWDIYT